MYSDWGLPVNYIPYSKSSLRESNGCTSRAMRGLNKHIKKSSKSNYNTNIEFGFQFIVSTLYIILFIVMTLNIKYNDELIQTTESDLGYKFGKNEHSD